MHSNYSHNLTHEFHDETTNKPKQHKIPTNELPPRSSHSWENKTASTSQENFLHLMETERSLPCTQKHLTCPHLEPHDSIPRQPTQFFYDLPSTPRFSTWSPSFSITTPFYISFLPHTCHMLRPSHPPWVHHPNDIWWAVQIMKHDIMHFSPASCHFLHPTLKHPQQPILRHHQLVFLPELYR